MNDFNIAHKFPYDKGHGHILGSCSFRDPRLSVFSLSPETGEDQGGGEGGGRSRRPGEAMANRELNDPTQTSTKTLDCATIPILPKARSGERRRAYREPLGA